MSSTHSSSSSSVQVVPAQDVASDALCALYDSVGWTTYTRDPVQLSAAIAGSDSVFIALEGDTLIGLARAISDDATVAYIQDILVRPSHQGRGVGRRLLQALLDRYSHVRQKILLTDDRPQQLEFYTSMGFRNTRDLTRTPLNSFVIIEGVELG